MKTDALLDLDSEAFFPEAARLDCARLSEYRRRVYTLIRKFRSALLRDDGKREALYWLRAIFLSAAAYFAVLDLYADSFDAGQGSAQRRRDHRRILVDLRETIDRLGEPEPAPAPHELEHALDALLMQETIGADMSRRAIRESQVPARLI